MNSSSSSAGRGPPLAQSVEGCTAVGVGVRQVGVELQAGAAIGDRAFMVAGPQSGDGPLAPARWLRLESRVDRRVEIGQRPGPTRAKEYSRPWPDQRRDRLGTQTQCLGELPDRGAVIPAARRRDTLLDCDRGLPYTEVWLPSGGLALVPPIIPVGPEVSEPGDYGR